MITPTEIEDLKYITSKDTTALSIFDIVQGFIYADKALKSLEKAEDTIRDLKYELDRVYEELEYEKNNSRDPRGEI